MNADTIESQVIDSLSWVYDNTRGKMNEYPFIISEGQDFSVINNQYLDVCFRPIFHDYPIPNYIPYYIPLTNNVDYYNSGISDILVL